MNHLAFPLFVALIAAPVQAAITASNPASDQLRQLSSLQRRAALRGALLDSGYTCPRVEKATIQGPWANLIMWRASCSLTDSRFDYAIFVGPDASIQARPCYDLKELKLPACRPFAR